MDTQSLSLLVACSFGGHGCRAHCPIETSSVSTHLYQKHIVDNPTEELHATGHCDRAAT